MGQRDMVIWHAKQEIGGLGPRQPTREQLDKYMWYSGTGYRDYASADQHTKNNWCGIFAVYCLQMAGVSCYWGINSSMNKWGICQIYDDIQIVQGNAGIQVGDVGVARSLSHHFIIEDVAEDYDYVGCLEGNGDPPDNAQWMGGVLTAKVRTLGDVAWYYRIA